MFRYLLLRFGLGLTFLGLLAGYQTYSETARYLKPEFDFEKLTLEELLAHGPEGNTHVIVRDFILSPKYETVKNPRSKGWDQVFVPLFSTKQAKPKFGTPEKGEIPKAILFSQQAKSPASLDSLRSRDVELRCTILPNADLVGKSQQKQLEADYPGIDVKHCLVLVEERRLTNPWGLIVWGCVALVFSPLGFALLYLSCRT